ncbi:MAG: SpoIIE family protein phosphatase [Planctomycetales bacterium]|nr:SpoIIE family protein phosphatase [Planctomycetales bacterium]
MSNKSRHLNLLADSLPTSSQGVPAPENAGPFEQLARAFVQTSGWELKLGSAVAAAGEVWSAPINDGASEPQSQVSLLAAAEPSSTRLPLERVRPLALAIANLLSEQARLRRALWEREAELAAGVPVSTRPEDGEHLAHRLAAILKGGADAVGCQSAGLYLLDETTTNLKLRAAHNLPHERLLEPARPLRGAMAELEALVGHAVVLEDTTILSHWKCPENFPSAICVPVSGSSAPLGTLWMFADQNRDFTSEQTNLVEIIAGRIAADLEREMLLTEGAKTKGREKHLEAAARWQSSRLPSVTPMLEDYEVAGWTLQADGIGGDFYDWSVLADGRLSISLGDAQGKLIEAGLGAAAVQAALKSHAAYPHTAAELLTRVNETLWTTSAGDQYSSLAYGLIDPASGELELSLSGAAMAIQVGRGGRDVLKSKTIPLGTDPDTRFEALSRHLHPGEFLILLSEGAQNAVDEGGLRVGELAMGFMAAKNLHDSAGGLLAKIRRLIDRGQESQTEDKTVLVVKRRK